MKENERFDHFVKKVYECLHLHFRHYLPQGRSEPAIYRDVFYHLYKMYYSGCLEELSKEPILDDEVKQLDLFEQLLSDKGSHNP